MTRATSLLGITLPIIQAPMAGVQGVELAIAVSNAGGLGSLPCAMLSLDQMRASLAAMRAGTSQPYNVNFFCHAEPVVDAARQDAWMAVLRRYYDELGIAPPAQPSGPARRPFSADMLDVLAEFKPPVVSFHFGLPAPELVAEIRAWGSRVLSSATTVDEARWLAARGVDGVIAQGLEAGGHRGHFLSDDLSRQMGTIALVSQIARAIDLPVVAAGGISRATSVAAALALGADGVQVGTAYLLCPEATTSPLHRRALRGEDARHTVITNVFTGRPARSIVNRLVRELGPVSALPPSFPLAAGFTALLRARAESVGSSDFSPLWCGQDATGCGELPAAEMTRALAAGFL